MHGTNAHFSSFGQACLYGEVEPIASLVLVDMGSFLDSTL